MYKLDVVVLVGSQPIHSKLPVEGLTFKSLSSLQAGRVTDNQTMHVRDDAFQKIKKMPPCFMIVQGATSNLARHARRPSLLMRLFSCSIRS